MERFNLFTDEPPYDARDPAGYRCGMSRFGPRIGATRIGGSRARRHFGYYDREP